MTCPLYDTLLADITVAMKARNTEELTTLRSMNAHIKDATINQGKQVSDIDVATVIAKAIKQFGVGDKVDKKVVVLPGHVAVLSGELEEELPDWEIKVGPREAVDLPAYMKTVVA